MPLYWTQLEPSAREDCASVSCGHAPARWRMDAGDTGSFFCDPCTRKIMDAVKSGDRPILKGASPVQVYQMNNPED